MKRVRRVALVFVCVGSSLALGCAGADDVTFGAAGSGGHTTSTTATTGTTTTTSTTDTTSTTTTTTTTTSGAGGSGVAGAGAGGGLTCDAPEHWCGNVCAGNTPATGCYQSFTCFPCQAVAHGTPVCAPNGLCTAQCTPPYVKSGDQCVCPSECCSAGDCQPPATCSNGQCTGGGACDPFTCLFDCLQSGHANGTCDGQGNCICT